MSTEIPSKNYPCRLAVIHWFPIEQFPPVQNILNFFAEQNEFRVLCCSTSRNGNGYQYDNPRVTLLRTPFPSQNFGRFKRLLFFIYFPLYTFFKLLLFRPDVILYLEPHSAPAVFLFSLFFPKCRIFAHYHEYREPDHLKARGNYLAWIGNQLEKARLFHKAEWLSHTNKDRARLFLEDYPSTDASIVHALPNMPPRKWLMEKDKVQKVNTSDLRLIYIGAISLHDAYLETLLTWFKKTQHTGITLDLYINNVDPATEKFLESQEQEGLTIHLGGVPYCTLPSLLPRYDIGLILYRCNTVNYVYNAPNKLFEYLACGLNVIYPKQMLGVLPYARTDCMPWVKGVDFEKLSELSVNEISNWKGAPKPWEETSELVYQPLLDKILRVEKN